MRIPGDLSRATPDLAEVLARLPGVVTVFDHASQSLVWASGNAAAAFGWTPEDLIAAGGHVTHQLSRAPEDESARLLALRAVRQSADGEVVEAMARVRDRDGTPRLLRSWMTPYRRDAQGRVTQHLALTRDVTKEAGSAAQLAHAGAFQAAVLAASPDVVAVQDVTTHRPVWVSGPVREILGWSADELAALGADVVRKVLPEDQLFVYGEVLAVVAALADGAVAEVRGRVVHRDGGDRWLHTRVTPFLRDADGNVTQFLAVLRDETEVVLLEQGREHAALHDALTGLPNRRLLGDRLDQAMAALARLPQGALAVLFCDLDNFKAVNDAWGHAAGDLVLRVVADRLGAAVRPGDTVARVGGDEFVVVLHPEPEDDVERLAAAVADRIERALARPVLLPGASLAVTASIGIAYASAEDDADTALREADAAMYAVKGRGKDGHAVFRAHHRRDALRRAGVESSLRAMLSGGGPDVHYQPVVELGSGRLVSAEALLRVRDSQGFLDAGLAVEVAERVGLIGRLGAGVLRRACGQAVHWRAQAGGADLTVAVNVSAREVARRGFLAQVLACLEAVGLDPPGLVLELTESVLLDAGSDTVAALQSLRDLGVGLAIDDFGTGYASLRYLAELPLTCLKIDRTFTAGLLTDPVAATLVRATAGLARDLGLDCVVEGVESWAQVDALPQGEHMRVQGFLFGRPVPAGQVVLGEGPLERG